MKKFANGFARLVFGLCVVMSAPAWALGDAPKVEAAKEAAAAPDKKDDAKCEGITLTGEKFLDMFHAIAMHGDLTDVPFIEQTLETRFEVRYSNNQDVLGRHYKRAYYTTQTIMDAPIEVSLTVDVERDPAIKNTFIGTMNMTGLFFRCVNMKSQDFEVKFGKEAFTKDYVLKDAVIEYGDKRSVGTGKNNSIIHVVYRAIVGDEKTLKSAKASDLKTRKYLIHGKNNPIYGLGISQHKDASK